MASPGFRPYIIQTFDRIFERDSFTVHHVWEYVRSSFPILQWSSEYSLLCLRQDFIASLAITAVMIPKASTDLGRLMWTRVFVVFEV